MLFNTAIGIAFVIAMSLLARTEVSWLNGILPLFPIFALIGQASTYAARGDGATREVALIGLASLIPYAVYLLIIVFFCQRVGFLKAALLGLGAWSIFAGTIVIVRRSL